MNNVLFANGVHSDICRCVFVAGCLFAPNVFAEALDELIFMNAFGSTGSEVGAFDLPTTVSVDSLDRIIVADTRNHRVQVCTSSGECYAFGSKGDAPGHFLLPEGVAVNSADQVVVADTGNGRVQICSVEGECSVLADGSGQARSFTYPLDVAIGSDDRIVVSEYRKGFQVCIAGAECSVVDFPSIEWLTVDHEDRIWSTDGRKIWSCDFEGACHVAFGDYGTDVGEFSSAHDLVADHDGRLFIADQGNARVQICSYDGDCSAFDIHRPVSQLMYWPAGIALTGSGQVVVADREGDRIHVYDLIAFEGPAIPINMALNDAWYDPNMPGQGFFINVFDKAKQSMFVAWFTYDIERPEDSVPPGFGDAGHRWLTAQGVFNKYTATLQLYNTSGLSFLANPEDPLTEPYGTMELRFSDCATGTIRYDIPSVLRAGEVPIYRLTTDSQVFCEQLSADFAQ